MVRRLEAGGVTLEESLALWERGEELAEICQRGWTGPGPARRGRRPGPRHPAVVLADLQGRRQLL